MVRKPPKEPALSRREREILDIIYARGRATAAEVQEALDQAPSYSAVRGLLRVLEEKGHLQHQKKGVRNVYEPTKGHRSAGRSALKRTLDTFFKGDVRQAVVALLDVGDATLSRDEIKRIEEAIRRAEKEDT